MFSLQLRMALLLAALFGIVYAIIVMIGTSMGVTNFYFYLVLSLGMMLVQYMIGPQDRRVVDACEIHQERGCAQTVRNGGRPGSPGGNPDAARVHLRAGHTQRLCFWPGHS